MRAFNEGQVARKPKEQAAMPPVPIFSAHFQASPRNHSTVLRARTQGRTDDMGSPEHRFSKILLENVGTKNTEDVCVWGGHFTIKISHTERGGKGRRGLS